VAQTAGSYTGHYLADILGERLVGTVEEVR
jgi:hypothetical protein